MTDPDAEIDPLGPVPPYQQLAAILRARIARGDWAPDRAIPSYTQLQQTYGLAHTTIARAIAVLEQDGVVRVVPRRGVFVARNDESP